MTDPAVGATELPAAVLHPPRCFAPVLPEVILRSECADFEVEEKPAYLPDGSGEHLYLWIEKTDVAAGTLLTRLAKQLQVPSRDIGVAGQKDRRAITRQFVSVPRRCEPRLADFADPQIQILSVSAHGNKLRTGHLTGNRFRIVLRSAAGVPFTQQQATATAQRLQTLTQQGFPNTFGAQRFGHGGRTALDGIAFLKRQLTARHWKPQQRRFMTKLVASAAQSAVFNVCLSARIVDGTFATPVSGDVVCGRDGIRPFLFDERGATAADNLIPMGPLPGGKMMASTGSILAAEQAAMQSLQLNDDDFRRNPKLTPGVRRRYVEYASETSVELLSDGAICVRFELSAGTFATTLLSEVVAGTDTDAG